MTEIEKTEGEIKVLQAKLELLKEMEKHRSPAEEAFKEVYGYYPEVCPRSVWVPFQKGYEEAQKDYKVGEYQPTPQTPEQVEQGLRDAMKQTKKDGVFDEPSKPMNEVLDRLENKYKDAEENAASYMTDEVVNRMLKRWETDPPSFLRFELGKTLEALITRWWDDVLYGGIHQDWDREVAIDDLIDQIQLWLPREQSHEGTQSASVIDLVDGYNDALTKIKSKLRNKKDT
jgi:hypothetical protein